MSQWSKSLPVTEGNTPLNSSTDPTQTLQALYSLPNSNFHNITSGYNGFSAGEGYDLVTGLGSPIGNRLIPDQVSYGVISAPPRPTPFPTPTVGPSPTLGLAPEQPTSALGPVFMPTSGAAATPPPAPPPRPGPPQSDIQATKTVVTSEPRPALFARRVVLTVDVTKRSRAEGKPTGQVTFWVGTTLLGTKTLRGGKASLSTTSLPLGRDGIEVIYDGGPTSGASEATIVETVKVQGLRGKAPASLSAGPIRRETYEGVGRRSDPPASAAFLPISLGLVGPILLDPAKPAVSAASRTLTRSHTLASD
jgi:hypothetical protein